MKPAPRIHAASRFLALLLCLGQVLMPLPALAASPVELATSPMATSTTTTVKPNLMFVLDDSGSMAAWIMGRVLKERVGRALLQRHQSVRPCLLLSLRLARAAGAFPFPLSLLYYRVV